MNQKAFEKYLATGEYVPTEDARIADSDAIKGSLEAHDRRFHPNGYKEGDHCDFRNHLAKGDFSDSSLFEGEDMEFKTREQLKAEHPFCDVSLRVCGNFGEIESTCSDEASAVKEYEQPDRWRFSESGVRLLRRGKKPKASAVIVRATDRDGNASYHRGWINKKRFKWDDNPESLRYEKAT